MPSGGGGGWWRTLVLVVSLTGESGRLLGWSPHPWPLLKAFSRGWRAKFGPTLTQLLIQLVVVSGLSSRRVDLHNGHVHAFPLQRSSSRELHCSTSYESIMLLNSAPRALQNLLLLRVRRQFPWARWFGGSYDNLWQEHCFLPGAGCRENRERERERREEMCNLKWNDKHTKS